MPVPQLWVDFVLAWFILFPAYAANIAPVLAKGRRPLDSGRKWRGEPLLGSHKTIEGTLAGILAGFIVGAAEVLLYPSLQAYAAEFEVTLPTMNYFIALMIALGVVCGDLCGSFLKRRMRMKPGADFPLADIMFFIIFAILFAYPFTEINAGMIVFMLILTPALHRLANFVSYKLRLKKVPW